MSKKKNAVLVLLAVIFNVVMVYSWYAILYPTEMVSNIDAVLGGAMLMFMTAADLVISYVAYLIAIAEDS